MSVIFINKTQEIEGAFTFNVLVDESVKPNTIKIEGILETKEYLDEIKEIESVRYKLTGVRIIGESYGSEDDKIQYAFRAKNYEVFKDK